MFELGERNVLSMHTDIYVSKSDFELIEDETIDIDNIEELDEERYIVTDVLKKINELIQAVKQLNKEIKSIKENK